MTCADIEVLLCDYIDGTLGAEASGVLEAHLHVCGSCAALAADAGAAVEFISIAAPVEPPRELVNRVLFQIPGRQQGSVSGLRWLRGRFAPLLQPRFAMGMAMTILSFSMLAQFAGIRYQWRPDDLRPEKVWGYLDDRIHRTWERAVKYYDSLRFVYEIQSRLNDWESASGAARTDAQPSDGRVGPAPANRPAPSAKTGSAENDQTSKERQK